MHGQGLHAGAVVRVREATLADAAAIAALMCPDISRWMANWPETMGVDEAEARLAEEIAEANRGSTLPLIVELQESGCTASAAAGWVKVCVRPERESEIALLGYWIGLPFQRRGLSLPAVRSAMALAQDRLGADKFGAHVLPENTASIRVLRGCGMEEVGTRPLYVPARSRVEQTLWFESGRPTPSASGKPM